MMRQVFAGVVLAFTLIAAAGAAPSPSPIAAQMQRVNASITDYNRTHSISLLDNALQSLADAGSQSLRGTDRATVLAGYLLLFGAIDRNMPHLPPGKLPVISVLPPRVNGVQYPAGTDPAAIPDPRARARYEQMIRENEAFTVQYLTAFSLKQVDARATMLLSDFAHDAFHATQTDQDALRHQIQASDLSTQRKRDLLAAVFAK